MKCDIRSWGERIVTCDKEPIGNCANCNFAWNYLGLVGPGSFISELKRCDYHRNGKVLSAEIEFTDGDPIMYTCRIENGKYFHLEEPNQVK